MWLFPIYSIAVSNVGQKEITIDARNGLATEKKMQGRPGKMSDYDGREETPVTEKTPVTEGCAIGKQATVLLCTASV